MSTGKPRVRVPKTAAAGETITIKTLINHRMESGQRHGEEGDVIPRRIINRFVVDFDGENVMDVALEPSVATNPFFEFNAVVPETGTFQFTWYDDDGSVYETSKDIEVA